MAPNSSENALRLGEVLARTGDSRRAVYFYNRALELAPNDPLALELKADVDAFLLEHPNTLVELLREGEYRPLTEEEAALQTQLLLRLANTTNLAADLDWFLGQAP